MQLAESEEIAALRETIRRFLAKEFPLDEVRRWDEEDDIPRSAIEKIAPLGICGLCISEEHGGMGRRVVAMASVMTELARHSQALAGLFNMNASYGGLNISESGSEEQKKRLLPQLLAGKLLFAYGLSEPDIGADLGNVKTRAERRGDRIVINGAKRWTSGANVADYIYALVRSGPVEARRKNLSFVLIPTDAHGVHISKLAAMGSCGVALHDVRFENVEITSNDVVGGERGWNEAWSILAGPSLEIEKLAPSCISLGIAEAAVQEAWEYSQQRVQGGKHICGHQAVRHVLAECQTELHACRLVLQNAAWLVETRQQSAVATSMAKLFITEKAKNMVLACQQYVMGAYGYAKGFNMERYVRDVLAGPIYGGSSAIQKNNIANLLELPRD